MRTFVLFGIRMLTEREWQAHIAADNADRAYKLQLEDALKSMGEKGTTFNAVVEETMAEQRKENDEIRAVVERTLSCNIQLAHRADAAEHTAALLRAELAKVLRQS